MICIHNYIKRVIANVQTQKQIMGKGRVMPYKAFSKCELDFAPITIQWTSRRGSKSVKCHITLLLWLATKTELLEIASELISNVCDL